MWEVKNRKIAHSFWHIKHIDLKFRELILLDKTYNLYFERFLVGVEMKKKIEVM